MWCLSEPAETQELPIDEFPCTNSCPASDPEVDCCNSAFGDLCFTSDDLRLFLSLLLKSLDPSESEVDSCDASDGDGLSFFLGRPDDVSDPSDASYALSFFLGSFLSSESLLLGSLDPSESEVKCCDSASEGVGLSFFLGCPDDVSDPSDASYGLSFFCDCFSSS